MIKIADTKVGSSNVIFLPKAVRVALGIKDECLLEWYVDGEKIVVKKE